MKNNRVEPSAVARAAAREMHEMFIALTDEGFTEKQALELLANMLKNAAEMNQDDE